MTREELIKWRKEHNLKQEDLARILNVSRVCITRWEYGTRKVPPFLHWALESISKHLKGGGKDILEVGIQKPKRKEVKKHGKSLSKR
jgi:DNA-binding XRE family transcriptional regulator